MPRGIHYTPADLAALRPDHPETRRQAAAVATALDSGAEATLQCQAERWLTHHGYWPRTPKHLAAGQPPKGWWLHFPQAQGNPFVLDLLILDNAGRWLEVELKSQRGRLTQEQRAIIAASNGYAVGPVRTIDEFRAIIESWECPTIAGKAVARQEAARAIGGSIAEARAAVATAEAQFFAALDDGSSCDAWRKRFSLSAAYQVFQTQGYWPLPPRRDHGCIEDGPSFACYACAANRELRGAVEVLFDLEKQEIAAMTVRQFCREEHPNG